MAEMGRLPAVREGAAQGDGPPQVAGIEASPWSSPKERKKAESGRAAGPVAASPGPLSLPSGKGRKGSRGASVRGGEAREQDSAIADGVLSGAPPPHSTTCRKAFG